MQFGLMLIGLIFAGVGWLVQRQLMNVVSKYSKSQLLNGASGKEIAEAMLRDNSIFDVKIVSVAGQLKDHYNPSNKTVNLSNDVYHGRSTMSTAISAHECGHAVQHALGYSMLKLRSNLVPVVNIASTVMPWILMLGIFLISYIPGLLLVAIVAQAIVALFTLITLPVEFDASRRALNWIESKNQLTSIEHNEAKLTLKWAAMTYVVSALAAVTQLVYLIMRYSNSRR